jgi:hypothetical protein
MSMGAAEKLAPVGLLALSLDVGLPAPWLREQALRGAIPCLRVGKRFLFNLGAVREALARLAAASRVDEPAAS